jgi:hypothetical protein
MLIAGGSHAAGSDDRILAPMPLGAVHPSYLIHVAGYNLGLIMRLLRACLSAPLRRIPSDPW